MVADYDASSIDVSKYPVFQLEKSFSKKKNRVNLTPNDIITSIYIAFDLPSGARVAK